MRRLLEDIVDVSPLLVALAAALILWVAAFGFATGFPFAYALVGFVVWSAGNHVLEIVEHRAMGHRGWPAFSIETVAGLRQLLGSVLLLVLAATAAGYWLLEAAGLERLARLTVAAVGCGLPALAALLAVTRKLSKAFQPLNLIDVAWRMGLGYAFLLALLAGDALAVAFAYRDRGIVALFAAAYGTLLLAYVLGSFVYAYRTALGHYAPQSPEAFADRELARVLLARRRALDHAYGIAAGGNIAGALAYFEEYARSEADALATKLWAFHEMMRWEDAHPALALGTQLLTELEAVGLRDAAAKVKLACEHIDH